MLNKILPVVFVGFLLAIPVCLFMVGMGIGYQECSDILAKKQSIRTDPVLRK